MTYVLTSWESKVRYVIPTFLELSKIEMKLVIVALKKVENQLLKVDHDIIFP